MSRSRIVLCSSAHRLDEAAALDRSREAFGAYAARHGWEYVEDDGASPERPPDWQRIALLRSLSAEADAVLFLAPGVAIPDERVDVTAELRPGAVLALTDRDGVPSTDVLLVRGGDESARLLDWIWNASEYADHPLGVRAALLDVLGWDVATLRPRGRTWAAHRTQTLDARWRGGGTRGDGVDGSIARTLDIPTCVIRGDKGSGHSLALVNDGLGGALAARGHEVALQPIDADPVPLPCPAISHSWPPRFAPASDGPTVLVLPWEYHHPPRRWVREVRAQVDEVWVPSAFVRDGYVDGGMPPDAVHVVPNGVDLDRFTPEGETLSAGLPRAACTFLFVGGTIWRKGTDVLLDAWERAFSPYDDVCLVVKDFQLDGVYRGQGCGPRVREMAENADIAPVAYLDATLAPEQLPALYRAADVLVTPYRGEGFCLPVLEAMACGLPAIHTGAGPTSEFCPPEAGWPLPSRRVELDVGSDSQGELTGRAWAFEVDPDVLAATLRSVAGDAAARAARGRAARRAAEGYSWDAAAVIAERRLAELAARPPLRWARASQPGALETRGTAVLYAPAWERPDEWQPVLSAWARTFTDADDATLVLAMRDGDHDAVAAQVVAFLAASGVAEDTLPDVLLSEPAWTGVHALVADCDVLLLDASLDAETRAVHSARAPRTLDANAATLAALAAELRAVPVPA